MSYPDLIRSTRGLVSYWPLGEATGTSARDHEAAANGTITNAPQLSAPVGRWRGMRFNGTSQYVEVPTNAIHTLVNMVSCEAWFVGNAGVVVGGSFIIHGTAAAGRYRIQINSSGQVQWVVRTADAVTTFLTFTAGPNYYDKRLHHLVGTYDNAMMRLYVDGVLRTSVAKTGNIVTLGSSFVRIGRDTATAYFGGVIAHAAIYDRALGAGEVAAHYLAGA